MGGIQLGDMRCITELMGREIEYEMEVGVCSMPASVGRRWGSVQCRPVWDGGGGLFSVGQCGMEVGVCSVPNSVGRRRWRLFNAGLSSFSFLFSRFPLFDLILHIYIDTGALRYWPGVPKMWVRILP